MRDLWDVLSQGRLERLQDEVDSAVGASGPSEARLLNLQRRMDRMVLAVAAMAELLAEKNGIAKEEIFERMHTIDARDGRVDGRITPGPVKCRKCKRDTNSRRSHCIYCGEALIDGPPVS